MTHSQKRKVKVTARLTGSSPDNRLGCDHIFASPFAKEGKPRGDPVAPAPMEADGAGDGSGIAPEALLSSFNKIFHTKWCATAQKRAVSGFFPSQHAQHGSESAS